MTEFAFAQKAGVSALASPLWLDLTNPFKEALPMKQLAGIKFQLFTDSHALWVVGCFPQGNRIALRTAYSPVGGLELYGRNQADGTLEFNLRSPIGDQRVQISYPTENRSLVRAVTWLRPAAALCIPYWPPDLIALGRVGEPGETRGTIHTHQDGPRSGIVYATVDEPASGAFLYLQNLTAMNEYAIKTNTSLTDTVAGAWPEMGFSLPPTEQEGLPADQEVVISDAFVNFSIIHPNNEITRAQLYLDMLAEIYLCLPRPEIQYHPWPDILLKCLHALKTASGVWSTVKRRRYLNAYLGDVSNPPESMVQLTVLLPLLEYAEWNPEAKGIAKEILAGLKNFYNKDLGVFVRWLPSAASQLDQSEPQKSADTMDSWYLYHPLLNLARLAKRGHKFARQLFFDSMDYAIRVARHFKYEWPVFYNMHTLKVLTAETKPGEGGEKDVPGIYLHVMMQAWDLSGEKRYLEEAKKAARGLEGNDLNLLYQSNDTLYGALGLLRLWKATGNAHYLELSTVCIANIFDQVWLWDSNYGYGRHFGNFFSLFPLKGAPYTAAYEELECLGALTEYLALGGKDLPASTRLLSAEYTRHLVSRVNYYFPPELPAEMIAEKPRTGFINPKLWIPLEDLNANWEKAGQVGQEVYGAGLAFGLLTRHYFRTLDESFLIFIDYPVQTMSSANGFLTLSVSGDQRLDCSLRIVPVKGKPLPEVHLESTREGTIISIEAEHTEEGHQLFRLKGNCEIAISWPPSVKKGKPKAKSINKRPVNDGKDSD